MKVFYYCSYKGSPVGFKLGLADVATAHGATLSLSQAGIPPAIQSCFTHGGIRRVCGPLPEEMAPGGAYALVLKKLAARDAGGTECYINIAFLAETEGERQNWLAQGEALTEAEVARSAAATMELGGDAEFGFKVRLEPLKALLEKPLGMLFGSAARHPERFFIEADPSPRMPRELGTALKLHDGIFKNVPSAERWFYYEKTPAVKMAGRPSGMGRFQMLIQHWKGLGGLCLGIALVCAVYSTAGGCSDKATPPSPLEQNIATLQNDVAALRNDVEALRGEIKSLEGEDMAMGKKLDGLDGEVDKLKKKLAAQPGQTKALNQQPATPPKDQKAPPKETPKEAKK